MALPKTVINLFPSIAVAVQTLIDLAVFLGVAGTLVGGLVWLRACCRREAVRLEARHRGLSQESTGYLVRLLGTEGADSARALLHSAELLRQRLANELGAVRGVETATRFAERAARLCEELRLRPVPFEGAPRLFERLVLADASDPDGATVLGHAVAVDEGNLTFVSCQPCPWAVRTSLVARPLGGAEPFDVSLVLGPMPGTREWVLGHELLGDETERRATLRFPCRVAAWTLPTTAGTFALRARLQCGEPLDPEALRRLPAWQRRHAATIEDISSEGARLEINHEVSRGERFYLVLSNPEGAIEALPLTEVVSIRSGEHGRLVLGARFCAVRMKERTILADYAQSVAGPALPAGLHAVPHPAA